MSEPAPPQPPQKPIRSAKWALIVGASLIGLFVLLDLISSIRMTAPAPRSGGKQPPTAISSSALRGFDDQIKQDTQDLQHRKEALQAAIQKARGVDLSRLATLLPECNQSMRDQLNGRDYVTATADGQPVRLACQPNDEWAVIPAAAASIPPLTPQQTQAMATNPYGTSGGPSAAERRKQEREKLREEALNSSSVALDFSSKPAVIQPVGTTQSAPSNEVEKRKAPESPYPWDVASGPVYRIFEGTVIETVLTNRLNGEFTGPVNVMITTDLYSHDHQHILMPQGTRILGEAMKVNANQQRRLAVVFHRAIMPDGYSVDFDKFAGLDQQGASGLTGRVNTHWMKVIGTAVLVGAIGGLAEVGSYSGTYGVGSMMETGVGAQTSQQATQILDRALNVLPSVTVYEGTRVRIWVAKDAALPAYENHQVNPNL